MASASMPTVRWLWLSSPPVLAVPPADCGASPRRRRMRRRAAAVRGVGSLVVVVVAVDGFS